MSNCNSIAKRESKIYTQLKVETNKYKPLGNIQYFQNSYQNTKFRPEASEKDDRVKNTYTKKRKALFNLH